MRNRILLSIVLLLASGILAAQTINLSKAVIISSAKSNSDVSKTTIRILREEVK